MLRPVLLLRLDSVVAAVAAARTQPAALVEMRTSVFRGRGKMANMQLFVGLSEDNKQVSVELHMDGKPLGHIFLSPEVAKKHAENVLRYADLIKMDK